MREFCKTRGYDLSYESDLAPADVSLHEVKEFLQSLNLPEKYKIRDYQLKAFITAIRQKRLLLLSPTSSGKSLIIYLICKWYNLKTLVIVPTTQLVSQLASDFADYGYEEEIHKITSGVEHYTDMMFTISTWQSMQREERDFFQQFDVVIVDEAHTASAKAISTILEKMPNAQYRIGTTGTINDTKCHSLVLQGHFGKIVTVTTTKDLMDEGHVAKLEIKCIVLKYPESVCKEMKNKTYQEEIDYICANQFRNNFIKKLAYSLEGNTLIFYQYVEKHGQVLNDLMQDSKKPLYFIHGGIDGDQRNDIKDIINESKESILLASSGTTKAGVSIVNLNDAIFTNPGKSKIEKLQSIGRQLRTSETKKTTVLYDIADDFGYKSHKNYTLNHFLERLKIYDQERFNYKIYEVCVK